MRHALHIAWAVTVLAWVAVWASIIARPQDPPGMSPSTVRVLQWLAGVTAAQALVLYLRLPRVSAARTRLVALPLLLGAAFLSTRILAQQIPGQAGVIPDASTMHLGYLVFPAGALTVGLIAAIVLDLLATTISLMVKAARR
jgi:hypothetical protein